MQTLRVLIAARSLRIRGGVQLYVRDLALGLRRRGHQPVVFSTELGGAADELGNLTVPVTSDLASFGARPDIIHGNHSLETMTALHAFPGVPAIFVSHGWGPWYAAAPNFPRIRRYVAVDDTCLDRMLFRDAVPEERSAVVLNAVDLDRFRPRHPLSTPPRRGLIFSNVPNE